MNQFKLNAFFRRKRPNTTSNDATPASKQSKRSANEVAQPPLDPTTATLPNDMDDYDDYTRVNHYKQVLTRAEFVRARKFGQSLLKGKTLNECIAAGKENFDRLRPIGKYISRKNQTYLGVAATEQLKFKVLWKTPGYELVAIGHLLLQVGFYSRKYCLCLSFKNAFILFRR